MTTNKQEREPVDLETAVTFLGDKRGAVIKALEDVVAETQGTRITEFGDFQSADVAKVIEYVNTKLAELQGRPADEVWAESSDLRQNIEEYGTEHAEQIAELDNADRYGSGPSEDQLTESSNLADILSTEQAKYHAFVAVYGE